LDFLQRSLHIWQRSKGGEEIKSTLKLLSRVDPKNETKYKEQYISYTDSLHKVQRGNRNKYARIQYETSAVESENKALSIRNITIGLISVLVIFVLVLLLILRYAKSQKRELQFKKQQQVADEELFELLRQHQIQLNVTRQKEQNRISTELHDGIMNKIYGVRLHLGMLNDRDDVSSKQKRLQYVDVLQDIEKEVRMISHDLHAETLYTNMDYIALLVDVVDQQNDLGKTRYIFQYDKTIDWNQISGLVKITINRILQEAISNVSKYADAQSCMIILTGKDKELSITIEDDGKGFDTSSVSGGIGLKNMKERAKTVSGKLNISSEPGHGTKLQFLVSKMM
jgi:signal transduction histidine kinase